MKEFFISLVLNCTRSYHYLCFFFHCFFFYFFHLWRSIWRTSWKLQFMIKMSRVPVQVLLLLHLLYLLVDTIYTQSIPTLPSTNFILKLPTMYYCIQYSSFPVDCTDDYPIIITKKTYSFSSMSHKKGMG